MTDAAEVALFRDRCSELMGRCSTSWRGCLAHHLVVGHDRDLRRLSEFVSMYLEDH